MSNYALKKVLAARQAFCFERYHYLVADANVYVLEPPSRYRPIRMWYETEVHYGGTAEDVLSALRKERSHSVLCPEVNKTHVVHRPFADPTRVLDKALDFAPLLADISDIRLDGPVPQGLQGSVSSAAFRGGLRPVLTLPQNADARADDMRLLMRDLVGKAEVGRLDFGLCNNSYKSLMRMLLPFVKGSRYGGFMSDHLAACA